MKRRQKTKRPCVVNCSLCGRDTINKSKICVNCTGGYNEAFESISDRQSREIAEALYGDVMTRDEEIEKTVIDELDLN